ncbi:FAD-dependent oxidoreductase [Aliiroseovarius crassostreae]|uniref:FAD-dependent oxidoreductase n=1 Tax=Aliiroseovarius crassostreae TaxID=154981 RepID=UPI0021AE99B8|nr:FAD-dependent oxidoreductase [Aliiroseovarius crassostreae]UWQ05898.1 FAD-dependent monooxygenase [Aliiroseovarius crassostreae]
MTKLQNHDITVLGGGIGGLTAAIALAQKGANVTVLEQAPEITEVGAGLQISPNGFRVLQALGLEKVAYEASMRSKGVWLRDGMSGREVVDLNFGAIAPDDTFLLFHRADLIGLLADAARREGVEIRLNQQVVDVEDGDAGVGVRFADGSAHHCAFLVGADGLHSLVRGKLNGVEHPFFTGQVAWRAIVPATGREQAEATVFMGPGRHMVTYPLRGGSLVNIVAVEERAAWVDEGWNTPDDPVNLRAAFAGFCDDAMALLERVEDVKVWGLHRHEVAPVWYQGSKGGHMVLLGDAAHPTLPFMAQGAVMALEDAWVLAHCLSHEGMERGGALYQARRGPRTRHIVEAANKNARNYHYGNPAARMIGHTALRLAGRFVPHLVYNRFRWIYDADVTADVTRP